MKGRGTELTVLAVLLLLGAVAVLWPGRLGSQPRFLNEKNAFRSLEEIVAAQSAYRGQAKRYWRDDVTGLYASKNRDGQFLKLIGLSLAASDARPTSTLAWDDGSLVPASPKAGYWYRALKFSGESILDPDRYAVCAYPDSLSAGKWMYLITDRNVRFRKRFENMRPPDSCPEDPEKEGWERRAATDSY